jgi:hypothetical protein
LGLGAAAVTLTTSTTAAGASAAGASALSGTKWGLGAVAIKGSLLGLAGMTAVAVATTGDARLEGPSTRIDAAAIVRVAPSESSHASIEPPVAAPPVVPAASAPVAASPIAPTARAAIRGAPATETSVHAETPKVSTLTRETAALDVARAAIRGGDPTRGLRVLDSYDREFPHGMLASESRVLRIEALSRAGNRTAARALGEDFLRTQPHHPLSGRVRELSGDP